MDKPLPKALRSFSLKPGDSVSANTKPPAKDWPHAPVHRLSENGVYFVTAGTMHKQPLLNAPAKLDLVECMLLSLAKERGWHLEAWAVLINHYHLVARGQPDSMPMSVFLQEFHSRSAIALNQLEKIEDRTVWYNFRDTRLTHQYSYIARLNYVHRNAVKHGLVPVANQYPWCSASWFERTASLAQVKTIYSFKTDCVKVEDDY